MGFDAHLGVPVGIEVGADQEAIVVHQRIDQSGVTGRIVRREHPTTNRLQHIVQTMGRGDIRHRAELMILFARLHLLRAETKDKHVLGADALAHFHVGPIQGADSQRAVQAEFHVAGA
ncbi:hypothetical protein D9M71_657880 [compost metagenome]